MGNAVVTGAHGVQYRPYTSGDTAEGIEKCFHTRPLWSSIRDGEAIHPSASIQQTDKTVTIWQLNKKEASSERIQAAQMGIKRLRTLRHPGILKYLDSIDTQDQLILVTEKAYPVRAWCQQSSNQSEARDELRTSIVWGLHCVSQTLKWLHTECRMVHGCLSSDAVFVTERGDWCIGNLDTTFHRDDKVGFQTVMNRVNLEDAYKGPERSGRRDLQDTNLTTQAHALDAWALSILIIDVFQASGLLEKGDSGRPIIETDVDTITQEVMEHDSNQRMKVGNTNYISGMPKSLRTALTKLLDPGYRTRISVASFLEESDIKRKFFGEEIVEALQFIDNLALKEPDEKKQFFERLHSIVKGTQLPRNIAKHKILPALKQALNMGQERGGGAVVISPMIEIGGKLTSSEYQEQIVPSIVSMFRSPERATRLQLLHKLPSYVSMVDKSTLNGEVCKNILGGFHDNSEALRQATVKSTVALAPHLEPDKLLELVSKGLKKSIRDSIAAVRVNTLVALGQIIRYFPEGPPPEPPYIAQDYDDFAVGDQSHSGDASKKCIPKPIVSKYQSGAWEIFVAGLRDPSSATRAGAIKAITYSTHCFSPAALSSQIVPHCSRLCTDPHSSQVREVAMSFLPKALKFLQVEHRRLYRLEEQRKKEEAGKHVGNSAASKHGENSSTTANNTVFGFGRTEKVGDAVGWAVSSLTGKWSSGRQQDAGKDNRIGALPQTPAKTSSVTEPKPIGQNGTLSSSGTKQFDAPSRNVSEVAPPSTPVKDSTKDGWDEDLFDDFRDMDWSPEENRVDKDVDLDLLDAQGTMTSSEEFAYSEGPSATIGGKRREVVSSSSMSSRAPPQAPNKPNSQKLDLDDDWDDFDAW
eukprot:gb/GECG01005612.1/.p1 GENE.gb/GECG01005612.1/~~gb/GECG01005612.1/.p1  ORF type:complete len:866 (+),score=105.90 gb/GECG01005612.1/:1-2598(+)